MTDHTPRFQLTFEPDTHRRVIAGKDVIIHCHHYNSRIQRTIESAPAVEGKKIFVSAAEAVFREQIASALRPGDGREASWRVAEQLYAHLGYGRIDLSAVDEGVVRAPQSHFVEGWHSGFPTRKEPVCSLAEGYLQAAIAAVTGEAVHVREEVCMIGGAPECRFAVDRSRTEPLSVNPKKGRRPSPGAKVGSYRTSPSVDEPRIIEALVQMPIHGDASGLIPAFNVYLANTPADFYNLVCLRFIEAMTQANLGSTARRQLVHDAETCAMQTFRGIMSSPEWESLVAPMVKEKRDELFGVIAISNGLGWGRWHVVEHTPGETLAMESVNGYEAAGYLEYRDASTDPMCLMLTGAAVGIMELIYGEGSIKDRFGQFSSDEAACLTRHDGACSFAVEEAQ